ncbi:cupredoxin domain-containing protein [Legionella hackeliae]|uniref:EfeO-type cupredoxin-like domain-containing protein n=1 Tax=Legionella hackeliae TaxID=449 RepID=A0A0A8UTP7_LEGHA|nr:cupredoxin domain-containing protein [Legionella hackeliae]KTD12816.1 Plastocyanin precursor [Legionella hackeliae]CEK12240.1 exported protein of unknown function [Legionella hackeliae]STX49027.1 Plastocyanin precursor [Legionella hackeliae]
MKAQSYFLPLLAIFLMLTVSASKAKEPISRVVMKEDFFSPKTLTVPVGTQVIWLNKGKDIHTVKSKAGGFYSGDIAPGASFSYRFTKSGNYSYICTHHTLFGLGMRGQIIVR